MPLNFIPEEDYLDACNAIREKDGSTALIKSGEMGAKIRAIQTGAPNGREWTPLYIANKGNPRFAYHDGVLVISEFDGGLRYSRDGKTVHDSNISSASKMYSIFYENGIWIAIGADCQYSTDGMHWDAAVGIDPPAKNNARQSFKIAYASNIWIVCIIDSIIYGGYNYYTYRSTDGKTWTKTGAIYFKDLQYHNGFWLGIKASNLSGDTSGIYRSSYGAIWTKVFTETPNEPLSTLEYGEGLWFIRDKVKGSYISIDGITWTHVDAPGYQVPVFKYGRWWTNSAVSYDGKNWIPYTGGYKEGPPAAYGNGVFIGINYMGAAFYSNDGINWIESNVTNTRYTFSCGFCDGLFIMGCDGPPFGGLMYSTDGKIWTKSNITRPEGYDLAFGNGIFLAMDNYRLWWSEDGRLWESTNVETSVEQYAETGSYWVIATQYAVWTSMKV